MICFHRRLTTLREDRWREGKDSWTRKIPIQGLTESRKRTKRRSRSKMAHKCPIDRKMLMPMPIMKRTSKTSWTMKNQKTLRAKRKTWNSTWTNLTRESIHLLRLLKLLIKWWPKWVTRKLSSNRSITRKKVRVKVKTDLMITFMQNPKEHPLAKDLQCAILIRTRSNQLRSTLESRLIERIELTSFRIL